MKGRYLIIFVVLTVLFSCKKTDCPDLIDELEGFLPGEWEVIDGEMINTKLRFNCTEAKTLTIITCDTNVSCRNEYSYQISCGDPNFTMNLSFDTSTYEIRGYSRKTLTLKLDDSIINLVKVE
ncbi:MAG: hypothetical protein MRY83_02385 [Flavobacteriales bacterium]|nr:hypothetical protein [Flavobacteriales bacterium]